MLNVCVYSFPIFGRNSLTWRANKIVNKLSASKHTFFGLFFALLTSQGDVKIENKILLQKLQNYLKCNSKQGTYRALLLIFVSMQKQILRGVVFSLQS